jgi:hypothetical protein
MLYYTGVDYACPQLCTADAKFLEVLESLKFVSAGRLEEQNMARVKSKWLGARLKSKKDSLLHF